MSRCTRCGAEIMFIRTKIGRKPMPCDCAKRLYTPGGRDRIVTPEGEVISCTIAGLAKEGDTFGYTPHWGTCPYADEFRRKR